MENDDPAVTPGGPESREPVVDDLVAPDQTMPTVKLRLIAIFLPALMGAAGVFLAVRWFDQYGWALFLGLPVMVAFLAAFILRRFSVVGWGVGYGYSLLAIIAAGAFVILFALDGLICLIMALPLAALLALPGAYFGYLLAGKLSTRAAGIIPLLIIMTFPAFLGLEEIHPMNPPLREVHSSIVIDAPIARVWQAVIAFDRITVPPSGIFRLGIAYPIRARIQGAGVGAVRYCIFSTGPFVEPITVWQPPQRLEFDVRENPLPMEEFSPYGHIDTNHLHGTFVSLHGRFQLHEVDGKVVLEGTTWYYQRIAPDWYWHLFSDAIIHQIHLRVLNQIKRQCESKA